LADEGKRIGQIARLLGLTRIEGARDPSAQMIEVQ